MKKRETQNKSYVLDTPKFTSNMKKGYTIIAPDMLPYHFEVLKQIFIKYGYNVEVLKDEGKEVIDEGLKYVHNDACYPALCVIGQFMRALKSGRYDVDKTAVLITQSGGGCRASNYIPLIRKALRTEFPQVPVLSLNFSGLEKDSGVEIKLSMLVQLALGIFYADAVMSLYNQCKPYEVNAGEADEARKDCMDLLARLFQNKKYKRYEKNMRTIVQRFAQVARKDEKRIRVGIVGEIYVKYSPIGNSKLEEFLYAEGCEPVVPALMDFVLYCIVNNINDYTLYGKNKGAYFLYSFVYKYLLKRQRLAIKIFQEYAFEPPHDFEHLRVSADKVLHQGVKMGEGWLIPAEMVALCESGVTNVVCAQPFGCLPNHIVGKGASRTVKTIFPKANIVPIDYDASATKVNRENRLKLMLETARALENETSSAQPETYTEVAVSETLDS